MPNSRYLVSILVVAASFVLFRHFTGTTLVRIETDSVIYRGVQSKSGKLATFYGIPYAEPPLGNRRFRAPVPVKYESGEGNEKAILDVQKKSAFCIQSPLDPSHVLGGAGSEECLHLNIYTPSTAVTQTESQKLPVLVYIHGGGFLAGNPLSWPFEHWVEQFPNTVIVSIYYRLSIFGFLAAPSGEKSAGFDANAGFLDQLEALKWIKKNIGFFGGDNTRITIDGQSAGGASVLLHLLAYGGKQQLFQQAIAQSVYRPGLKTIAETKDHFNFVVEHAQCGMPGFSESDKVDCLRTKEVATLMRAAEAAQRHNSTWRYIPVVDGVIFQDTPTVLMNKGKISHVPVLTGATTDEAFARSDDMETELKRWYASPSQKDIAKFNRIYPESGFASKFDAIAAAVGETLLRCASETLVEVMERRGKRSYIYRFDERNPTQDGLLVQHSAENWWMFQGANTGDNGTFVLTPFTKPSQERFATELIAYWLSFVHAGDPNAFNLPGVPHWPAWSSGKGPTHRQRMVLKQRTGLTNESGSFVETKVSKELDRCHAVNLMAARIRF
ncbi:hypothetical protein M408DRAFT_330394 [Serendipita vermifera MAFF 305830]|uniref:Carboxylic ester hydrolase n=1 Tax=Serendipita vermifera MAFF 305830 TaxID=933852 RepID=A0A0C2XCA5_SERVB|nr:hypothetical protein M408DRAFT_330394 [Serendipita vermifera MAFF 305830]